MVHEQGEVVDSIEGNVETAAVAVTEGADQLRQAEIYKVGNVSLSQSMLYYSYFIRFCLISRILALLTLFDFRTRPVKRRYVLQLLVWLY